jgi:hypothetical protein
MSETENNAWRLYSSYNQNRVSGNMERKGGAYEIRVRLSRIEGGWRKHPQVSKSTPRWGSRCELHYNILVWRNAAMVSVTPRRPNRSLNIH